MFRSLLSAVALFALLFVTLAVPAAKAARRCPDEPPSTILSLYKASDVVYIGKFEKAVDGEVVRSDEDSKTVMISQHFSVSSTIKGESRKFYVRDFEEYRYNQTEPVAEDVGEEEYDEDGAYKLESGDNVILFLKYVEEEEEEGAKKPKAKAKKKLDVAHYRDGVKKVKASELSSYESKIRDLKGILSSKKVNDAEVLAWLIRCIDDPVTRWDGAYELNSSFQTLEWQERQKQEEAEAAKNADAGTADDSENGEAEHADELEEEEFDNSVYAKLLTDAQKAHLMELALASKPARSDEGEGAEVVEESSDDIESGDRMLFEVVKRWGDARLADAMLDRLRGSSEVYDKLHWISMISEILKDKELSAIEEKFGNVTYQEDDEEVVEEKKSDSEVVVEPEGEVVSETVDEDTVPSVDGNVDDSANTEKAKKTYKQYRDELVADFITKASAKIAEARNAEAADKEVAR